MKKRTLKDYKIAISSLRGMAYVTLMSLSSKRLTKKEKEILEFNLELLKTEEFGAGFPHAED